MKREDLGVLTRLLIDQLIALDPDIRALAHKQQGEVVLKWSRSKAIPRPEIRVR